MLKNDGESFIEIGGKLSTEVFFCSSTEKFRNLFGHFSKRFCQSLLSILGWGGRQGS